ncbi:RCC1/BLIP-II protein [Sistotremastrum suecicum HHB10207 ss-3]|uniref:RCC1/BLIP-II protein n=1 Tax=Sistotremastrum suecicum HHB10207 ss-3 TaxID=1314776 RepID=A0A166GG61_9AGAM|nr:RCC1/BLIP-II protein [Sistotremastrum suecicum HHB10207 ss-3]
MPTRVFSCGSNACGQLSLTHTDDAHTFSETQWSLPPPRDAKLIKIACGGNHTLALFDDGDLWGCGSGSKGQLGESGSRTAFKRIELAVDGIEAMDLYRVVDVGCTWESSFVVLRHSGNDGDGGTNEDDILLSMGSNDFGILGRDPMRSQPDKPYGRVDLTQVADTAKTLTRGRRPPIKIRQLHTGVNHIILILSLYTPVDQNHTDEEIIVGWGAARHGQLGVPPSSKSQTLLSQPTIIRVQPPDTKPGPVRVQTMALGNQHSVILVEDGTVQSFGSNRKSQLMQTPSTNPSSHIRDVACTWNGTYIHAQSPPEPEDWSRWSIEGGGSNTYCQLATPDTSVTSRIVEFPFSQSSRRLVKVVCGSEHILALFESVQEAGAEGETEVWGWGWNEHGNLGLGHTKDVSEPVCIWPQRDSKGQDVEKGRVVGVWAGCGTSWIAVESNQESLPSSLP